MCLSLLSNLGLMLSYHIKPNICSVTLQPVTCSDTWMLLQAIGMEEGMQELR